MKYCKICDDFVKNLRLHDETRRHRKNVLTFEIMNELKEGI